MLTLLPRSLRGRLLLIVLSAVVTTAALVCIISAQVLSGFLRDRLEQRLQTITEQITSVASRAPDRVADATSLRNFLPADSLVVLQPADGDIVSFGGDALNVETVAATARDMAGGDTRRLTAAAPGDGSTLTFAVTRVDTDGLRIRLEDLPAPIVTEFIIFAVDVTADQAALARLIWTEAVVGVLTGAAVGVVAVVVITLGIRPLRLMAATADSITSGDRARRLPVGRGGIESEHLAASINRALDAQQEAEERLRTFLDDVSHELRTPLTTVNGWIDLYLQGGLQDDVQRDRAMERVEAEVSRMRTLVDELTLLSRLDAHRALETTEVNLGALAREVMEDAEVLADGRALSVDAQDIVVVGDRARLAQVLRNLVGNAMQHTPVSAAVSVQVHRDGEEAIIRVHDRGPGISEADAQHVFERFWRAEPSRSRATGGSGLGLAIVAAIVQAHGGAIRVASDSRRGTTFTVSLPYRGSGPADGSDVLELTA